MNVLPALIKEDPARDSGRFIIRLASSLPASMDCEYSSIPWIDGQDMTLEEGDDE